MFLSSYDYILISDNNSVLTTHSDKLSWMNQENAYSKGCEVKYLLKNQTIYAISKRISLFDSKTLNAATPWEGILTLSTFFATVQLCISFHGLYWNNA